MSGDNRNTAAAAGAGDIPKDGNGMVELREEQNIVNIPAPAPAPAQAIPEQRGWKRSSPESEIEDGEAAPAPAPAPAKRNRGPWTMQEHMLFLQGIERCGPGAWKRISTEVLTTRSATQIASHAQKYNIRQKADASEKKKWSIHDITTVQQALAQCSNQSPSSTPQPQPIASFNPSSSHQPQPTTSFNQLQYSTSFNPSSSHQPHPTTSFNYPQPVEAFNPYSSQQPFINPSSTQLQLQLPYFSLSTQTPHPFHNSPPPIDNTTYNYNPRPQTYPPTPTMDHITFLRNAANAPSPSPSTTTPTQSPFMGGNPSTYTPFSTTNLTSSDYINYLDSFPHITDDMFATGPSNPTMFAPEPEPKPHGSWSSKSAYPPPPDA